ncbi:MAG: hypothetical protein AABW89_05990 [Nanoarchaeota archaeon]
MKIENHIESFKEHKETIFDWAVKVKGIKNSQRVIGLHASRAIIDLLSIYLIKRNLISTGMKINHRWFKSEKVNENLPEFERKEEICGQITNLNFCART